MSSTADAGDVVEITDDGITVSKSFTADEFPVPAIRFEFESTHDTPVAVRLTEEIPESFPMDGVGFHPEYHSDQWTAFQDNRVEFVGTVEPDESLVTVYGIRIDDESEGKQFLSKPTIADVRKADDEPVESDGESGSTVEDTMIGDIVSDDRNQVVKDMLSGESKSVPGLDDTDAPDGMDEQPPDLDLDLGDVDTEPVDVESDDEADATPDIDVDFEEEIPGPGDESVDRSDDGPKIEIDVDAAAERVEGDDGEPDHAQSSATGESSQPQSAVDGKSGQPQSAVDGEAGQSQSVVSDSADDESESAATIEIESVSAALAEEIREDRIDEEDLAVIEAHLDVSPTGSDLAKVDHLQNRVEEVAAYTDALEEFLDENGSAQQLLETFESDLEECKSTVESFDDALEETQSDVSAVDEYVREVDDDVDAMASVVDDIADELASVDESVDHVRTDLEDVTATVDDLDDDIDNLESDVESVSGDVESVEDEVTELSDELESVREDVTDLVDWRDQLGSMFADE